MNEYAHLFYKSGFSIVPLKPRSKQPMVKWAQYQQEQPPEDVVFGWDFGRSNLGVVTGYNGLTVIDFDDSAEYLRWLSWVARRSIYPIARHAFTVRSRRGVHVYFRILQATRNRHIGKIDIKGRYGLVTGPGSIHETGIVYEPLTPFFIPTIGALSDILPARLLIAEETHPIVQVPAFSSSAVSDPWTAAECTGDISDSLVARIRKKFAIEQFFKTLRKTGEHYYLTQCPFHDDQTPSFWIDAKRQICNCFACNFPKALDVINLYALMFGLSNRDAIFTLATL